MSVSSIHALKTSPLVAPYAAAQAAFKLLTRLVAIKGRPLSIRVNAVLPGAIDTPMRWENPNVKSGAERINKADVRRPKDVADAVAYLAADHAAFVQGIELRVDGGHLSKC